MMLAMLMILPFCPLPLAAQQPEPKILPARARTSHLASLKAKLRKVMQQDDMEEGAQMINQLLLEGMDASQIFMTLKRGQERASVMLLVEELERLEQPVSGMEEVLLLLCSTAGDSLGFEEHKCTLAQDDGLSNATLFTIAQEAFEQQAWDNATWALFRLKERGELLDPRLLLSLAQSLIGLHHHGKAASVLDEILASGHPSGFHRDRASILRARILFIDEGKDEEALQLLAKVRKSRTRERSEALLLQGLIRYLDHGDESHAERLIGLAGTCPDLDEANDALALARLAPLLPEDEEMRKRILAAQRMELRRRWCDAARAYHAMIPKVVPPLAAHLTLRAARCWEQCGEMTRALAAWMDLGGFEEMAAVALLGQGDCLARMVQPESAAVLYMELLTRYPGSPHAARARSRLLQ